ncbi:MAG: class II glutamine amidotransferase, partial [Vampirovibrionia bacterium]
IMGSTDSEYMFYLFISNLRQKFEDINDPAIETVDVKNALVKTLNEINTLSTNVGITIPSKINTIATNGKIMAATRFGHSLYYALKTKEPTKDIKLYKDTTNLSIKFNNMNNGFIKEKNDSVIIASEILNAEDRWFEVPEQSVLTIDSKLRTSISAL